MIKRVTAYWLKPGVDGDKFWDYHRNIHTKDIMNLAGDALKKYTIQRPLKATIGNMPTFFALIEMWWEDEEKMNKAFEKIKTSKLPNGNLVWNDFWDNVSEAWSIVTDEYVAKG